MIIMLLLSLIYMNIKIYCLFNAKCSTTHTAAVKFKKRSTLTLRKQRRDTYSIINRTIPNKDLFPIVIHQYINQRPIITSYFIKSPLIH